MTAYVALLRGINVGRANRIGMADLRALLTDLGYGDVRTLLQSGNAVFTAQGRPATVIREIEAALAERHGMAVRVLVRTAAELRAVVDGNPMAEAATDPSKFVVTFLSEAPDGGPDPDAMAPDTFVIAGREVYMWFPNGIRDAKLAAYPWHKLGVVASGRNWTTVQKLTALAEAA